MYYLKFLAYPRPTHPDHGVIAGAFVHCWINEPVEGAAKMVAIGILEQQRWTIEALEESAAVSPEDYADDPRRRRHAEQAAIDGMTLVYESWPVEASPGGDAAAEGRPSV